MHALRSPGFASATLRLSDLHSIADSTAFWTKLATKLLPTPNGTAIQFHSQFAVRVLGLSEASNSKPASNI